MNIISKEKINKGWSNDTKYCITDENNLKYLLRVSPNEEYYKKLDEFKYMCECNRNNVKMCKPIEIGKSDEGVYSIQSWIDGVDALEFIPTLSDDEQYQYGIIAGKELKKIHLIKAPSDTPNWETKFNQKVDCKIKKYLECSLKYEKGNLFIKYINENRHLLHNRPNFFQHGDYHIGNMMINKEKELVIIDFNRFDFGDPWEEFNRLVWCVQASKMFAKGMVDGYFNQNVPDKFWRLLALYISSNALSSLPWAVAFGEKEINTMLKHAKDILSWYKDMKEYIPNWYTN